MDEVALRTLVASIEALTDADAKLDALNAIKLALHQVSPLSDQPIDCVLWVRAEAVRANDYNPNVVAPPEMKLLQRSIDADGYTQPIVTHTEGDARIVVDGFHRHRVGRENLLLQARLHGRLPVTTIRSERGDRQDRIAATIRHNRARGKHGITAMSDIVQELSRRNWSEEKIGEELGMEADEVLRLKQITGLAEMFADREFSEAWEAAEQ